MRTIALGAVLVLFAVAGASAPAGATGAATVDDTAPSEVSIDKTVRPDGTVTGVVRNTSSDPIQHVTLVIQHSWHWKNDYRPGDDNPGRTAYQRVDGPIPPGASAEFRYVPAPPLPDRDDGHFVTTIAVQSFTSQPDRQGMMPTR